MNLFTSSLLPSVSSNYTINWIVLFAEIWDWEPWSLSLYSVTISDKISNFFCIKSIGTDKRAKELGILGSERTKVQAFFIKYSESAISLSISKVNKFNIL